MNRNFIVALGLLPCFLAGCVEGQVGNLFKYDKNADTFHLVQFYTNLHATQAKDLDHLANLWKKKNALIVSPVDGDIFATYALERLGKHEYRPVSLGEPDKQSPSRKTRANLDSVKVLPGEFYLNQRGYLGGYQQAIVPGQVVDALIEDFTDIFGHIAKEANRQIELADKTDKVRKLSWEEVRKELVGQLAKNPPPRPKDDVEDQWPLEMASLKRLAQVGKGGLGKIARAGDAFTIVLPVTAKDAQELAALADLVRKTVAQQVKEGQPVENGTQKMLEAVQVRALKDGIALTIEAGKFFGAYPVDLNPMPDASKQKGYQATVVGVQGRGIPLSNETELRKLVKDFGVKAAK